jgi:hypothetical protein
MIFCSWESRLGNESHSLLAHKDTRWSALMSRVRNEAFGSWTSSFTYLKKKWYNIPRGVK